MKPLIFAVLAFSASCAVETAPTPAPDPTLSADQTSQMDDDAVARDLQQMDRDAASRDMVNPRFVACNDDEQCMTPSACTQFMGTPGTLFCSSGGRTCCAF